MSALSKDACFMSDESTQKVLKRQKLKYTNEEYQQLWQHYHTLSSQDICIRQLELDQWLDLVN